MAKPKRFPGEPLFGQYLNSQGFTSWEFEKEPPGKRKHPDYTIQIDGREYLFDVKEFEPQVLTDGFIGYNPYVDIRGKIDKGREQFKEYKDYPCSLVLYNEGKAHSVHLTNPRIMFGVMLGDVGFALPYNPKTGSANRDAARPVFHRGGKMIVPRTNEPQNTTINALITLRHVGVGQERFGAHMRARVKQCPVPIEDWFTAEVDFDRTERQLGVIVWENPFARIPLPRNIFCGPYDERYVLEGDSPTRVFVGGGIVALENLRCET